MIQASHRFPWRRLRDVLAWRFPLSTVGLAVLLLALTALYGFGYQRMDLVVFALTVCALVITLAALLLTTLSGLLLRRRPAFLKGDPMPASGWRLEAGYPNETGFSRPALPWLPLVSLQWRVVWPDAIETRIRLSRDGRRLEEELTPLRRCLTERVTRRFTISDVLGLARYSWTHTTTGRLMALPRTGLIHQLPLLRSLSAEDGIPDPGGEPIGDRMEIRPYTPGDPVRHILWNVYARNRHLNVRLEEKSVFHSRRTLAYLISADDDEAAAATARVAVESGALGDDWIFGADGSGSSTRHREEALEYIAASRTLPTGIGPVQAAQGAGLETFLRVADNRGAHCIVFAPAGPGAWTRALQKAAARHPGQFSVVIATDGFEDERPEPLSRRLLFRTPREDDPDHSGPLSSVARLRRTLDGLGRIAGHAVIIDRRTGQSFDRALKKV
ncbi:MAG: DUF58 domain-containing protein [Pseudohongiellaceae bacterium]